MKKHKVVCGLVVVAVVVYVGNEATVRFVRRSHPMLFGHDAEWYIEKIIGKFGGLPHINSDSTPSLVRTDNPDESHVEFMNQVVAMEEIHPFDQDALHWANWFSFYHASATVFDANGDGRLDIYFGQDGENWTRPTDDSGVLKNQPAHQHNALYLNMGNDAHGHPRFKQVKDLVSVNATYVKEELLVENFLYPRENSNDSLERTGRKTAVAVAADLNNDGRCDLLVGNCLPGMFWTSDKTQRIISRFVDPSGRKGRRKRLRITALGPHFISHKVEHNMSDIRDSARNTEALGANSLFLNLGDRDGDGIPEWQDVSRDSGVEGQRHTVSFAVADIDLDGDLDVYEGNSMDFDYWPGGSLYWAGGANQLYINQLAETGELRFVEKADEMDVDGVYDEEHPMPDYYKLRRIPFLPVEYSLIFFKLIPHHPEIMELNNQRGEAGQISWATLFQDVNGDGFSDLWVANDLSELELFMNVEGRRFKKVEHLVSDRMGSWMSFAAGDFNGDLQEDLFVGNLGAGAYSISIARPDPFEMLKPIMVSGLFFGLFHRGYYDTRHIFVDGRDPMRHLESQVRHSKVLPPDNAFPNNVRSESRVAKYDRPLDLDSIDPYEFTWGSVAFDIQNDGELDLYFLGGLYGRAGGVASTFGVNPGRLLVNAGGGRDGACFVDLTAEHHVFNISELKYDRLAKNGFLYRRAPTKNWSKRDMVYSHDRSGLSSQGRSLQGKASFQDMIQTSENGRTVVAVDMNGDGFEDLILRSLGGYDSRSSGAKNLTVRMPDGEQSALPSPDHKYPTLTSFEPGATRFFLNRYAQNHWLKVRLLDDSADSFNRDAIGARVIVNGKLLRVQRSAGGAHGGNWLADLHFGLKQDSASELEIHWPDRARTVSRHTLDNLKNGTVTFSKERGLVSWESDS